MSFIGYDNRKGFTVTAWCINKIPHWKHYASNECLIARNNVLTINLKTVATSNIIVILNSNHSSEHNKCITAFYKIVLFHMLTQNRRSQKIDTDVAHCNLNKHQPSSVTFCRDVADRVCYQMVICYPTSPKFLTNVSALPGETWIWIPETVFSVMLHAVSRNRHILAGYIFDIHQSNLIFFADNIAVD